MRANQCAGTPHICEPEINAVFRPGTAFVASLRNPIADRGAIPATTQELHSCIPMLKPSNTHLVLKMILLAVTAAAALIGAALLAVPAAQEGFGLCFDNWCL